MGVQDKALKVIHWLGPDLDVKEAPGLTEFEGSFIKFVCQPCPYIFKETKKKKIQIEPKYFTIYIIQRSPIKI